MEKEIKLNAHMITYDDLEGVETFFVLHKQLIAYFNFAFEKEGYVTRKLLVRRFEGQETTFDLIKTKLLKAEYVLCISAGRYQTIKPIPPNLTSRQLDLEAYPNAYRNQMQILRMLLKKSIITVKKSDQVKAMLSSNDKESKELAQLMITSLYKKVINS